MKSLNILLCTTVLLLSGSALSQGAPAKKKPAAEKPAEAPAGGKFEKAPELKWDIATKERESDSAPESTVKLVADGKSAAFVNGLNLKPLEADARKAKKAPSDALVAVGGWWAGGGDYYYVKLEKGVLVAYHAIEEEGSAPGLKYKVFKKFTPADFK